MASIDSCLRLLSSEKDELFRAYERNLTCFGEGIKTLKNLIVPYHGPLPPHPGFFAFDPGKIVVVTNNTPLSGFMLADILRAEHKIEVELASDGYAVAMTSICDIEDGFARLAEALVRIDRSIS